MLGAFVEAEPAESFFLCGDAIWTLNTLENREAGTGVHRLIADNRSEQDACYRMLTRLHGEFPEVKIVPSHCPRAAAEHL